MCALGRSTQNWHVGYGACASSRPTYDILPVNIREWLTDSPIRIRKPFEFPDCFRHGRPGNHRVVPALHMRHLVECQSRERASPYPSKVGDIRDGILVARDERLPGKNTVEQFQLTVRFTGEALDGMRQRLRCEFEEVTRLSEGRAQS